MPLQVGDDEPAGTLVGSRPWVMYATRPTHSAVAGDDHSGPVPALAERAVALTLNVEQWLS